TPAPLRQLPKRLKPSLCTSEKLDKIFDLFREYDWTLGDFLHHLFTHRMPIKIISRAQIVTARLSNAIYLVPQSTVLEKSFIVFSPARMAVASPRMICSTSKLHTRKSNMCAGRLLRLLPRHVVIILGRKRVQR
ncbi:hypothetical protein B0H13DRAFT_1611293, partial [Mycena leptocephala]